MFLVQHTPQRKGQRDTGRQGTKERRREYDWIWFFFFCVFIVKAKVEGNMGGYGVLQSRCNFLLFSASIAKQLVVVFYFSSDDFCEKRPAGLAEVFFYCPQIPQFFFVLI